ncbi:nitric oxide synthase [Staphylococcus felis]|uniref:nitric oxide synthase oxygenase n=1 Tax=Staphylococcus felis TaxID=46127 RepID=UPI000E262041|nr:nitric oxide synthase oxygenase [Staphylococcus felis]REI00867.1 nitric oxide synthase [Staphylococcus felis]REI25116.1 nitric oxide synthase [Staphylococcus felis]
MFTKARLFIEQMYGELGKPTHEVQNRLKVIKEEIESTGTYYHTTEELTYGAKMAWRNSNKCIGRLFWERLAINDARHIKEENEFIESINHHLSYATNNGRIKPYITIYAQSEAQGPKIFNHQLIRYAGYEHAGDPSEREITQLAEHLGWRGEGTHFDVLPLIYQLPNHQVKFYEYPKDLIKEVDITHTHYPNVEKLGYKWYAVPIISNMDLKIGGITYPTVPFNGWYMVNEIAVRNFTDTYRYNFLPQFAEAMGFHNLKNSTFNKDRVLVEINAAVYQSFKNAGVSIVDHLTASKQFEQFEKNERINNRSVTGKWSWLAPPLSPSLTPNYHHGYDNTIREPNFFYKEQSHSGCPFH